MTYGRAEIERRRRRLSDAFSLLQDGALPSELSSHHARYLCVLTSGFVEQCVKVLIGQYCRVRSNGEVHRYVSGQLKRVRNLDTEDLRRLVSSFNPAWWAELETQRPDELEVLNSIAAVRNGIAHGSDVGIGMTTVAQYFKQACVVVEDLAKFFDPPSAVRHTAT